MFNLFDRKITQVLDPKIMVGVIGASVIFGGISGYALSSAVSSGSYESPTSQLISQQTSVVANNIQADANDCASGTKNGTIGFSVQQALKIHTEIASATPNVESLFDIGNDCFSGLNQIFDLSVNIPSLSTILSAVESAVLQYAQKKICTAVAQVSGMVTTPLNQAIQKVNNYTNLNGMMNGGIANGLSQIDSDLGAEYHKPPAADTYTVGFDKSQVDFGGSDNSSSTGSSNINDNIEKINTLNQQIGSVQAKIQPAQRALDQAKLELTMCSLREHRVIINKCSREQQAVENSQNTLDALNRQLASLQGELAGMSRGTGPTKPKSTPTPSSPNQPKRPKKGYWHSIGDLFEK